MTKQCLRCGIKITGRIDKKFCNNACKNDFHNNRQVAGNTVERYFFSTIRKNRSILMGLMESGVDKLRLTELEQYGFSFMGLTGVEESAPGAYNLHCCDFIIEKEGKLIKIQKSS